MAPSHASESALKTLLRRAVPYETVGAPLDANLRLAMIISLVTLFVASLILLLLFNDPPPVVGEDVFLSWLYMPLQGVVSLLYDIRTLAFWVNEAAFISGLFLVLKTRGFKEANRLQNCLTLGPIVVATLDGLTLAVIVALVFFIILVWALIIALAIALIVAALAIVLSEASR